MAKNIATTISPVGSALAKLLIKAAGLEGKRVMSLTCECSRDKAITFSAVIIADEGQVSEAMGVDEVPALIDELAENVSNA